MSARAHALGVERENLVVEAGQAPLVFGNQERLEGAVAVARCGDREPS